MITSHSSMAQQQRYEFDEIHMGTKFKIVFYADNDSIAENAAKKVFKKIENLDNILSDYKQDSELNHLSHQSDSKNWIPVSSTLFDVIYDAQKISCKTKGAFDITVGPFVQHWRTLTRSYEPDLPSKDTLESLSTSVGYQYVNLDKRAQAVQFKRPDMQIDLGGIAKGYAADKAIHILKNLDIQSALVDAGGDITVGDPPPGKEGWNISVNVYKQEDPQPLNLLLSNMSIATSGDLYDHVVIDGKKYSHIINPKTGLGLTEQSRVSIIAPTGILADSYASAVSVLGPAKGKRLLQSLKDVEGLIEVHEDSLIKNTITSGFSNYQTVKDEIR